MRVNMKKTKLISSMTLESALVLSAVKVLEETPLLALSASCRFIGNAADYQADW